jgi:hypothetical protein
MLKVILSGYLILAISPWDCSWLVNYYIPAFFLGGDDLPQLTF